VIVDGGIAPGALDGMLDDGVKVIVAESGDDR
jgi:hypothetical protein